MQPDPRPRSLTRPAVPRLFAALFAGLVLMSAGCGGDTIVAKNLFLEVSSEAPLGGGKLQSLRILLSQKQSNGSVKLFPLRADDVDFNPVLGALDPVSAPVLLSLKYDGTTFGDGSNVTLQVTGRIGLVPVTQVESIVDLAAEQILKVRLTAIPANCDADGDGFLDCATAGCCAANTAFGDCEPTSAEANPWGVEPECEPCSDTVDQDCKGGDQACVDGDGDGIADCAEATCGLDDPNVGPGLPEVCDGKDNDCNSQTDEGLTLNYDGRTLNKGDSCGRGKCAGGVVECDGTGGLRCSTESQRQDAEVCGNAIDDDCNGTTDEGCQLGDFDGDGVALPTDCNDFDAGVFPGRAGEPCCPRSAQGNAAAEKACDLDCSGQVAFCEAGDVDGDGITVNEGDCDDNDPMVGPGKPERCGDGVDQDCFGGDLPCTGLTDGDGDGWPATVDCDDGDRDVHPGAAEVCNGADEDCDQLVDEGDPDGGARCGSTDVGACEYGLEHCKNSGDDKGQVLCVGNTEPLAAELCNGQDDDCDGSTDETFEYDDVAIGQACDGVGACGAGVVECAQGRTDKATCSTNPDGSASQATTEVCDALDNDCDGETNENLTNVEDSTCLNAGVCAANRQKIAATCTVGGTWSCDYAQVPGYEANLEKSCDGKDNDCDGGTDEDLTFTQPDGAVRNFGGGCDGPDEDVCPSGIVRCAAADVTKTFCDETGNRSEVCDGLDNDCDGQTDEDFKTGASNRVTLSGANYSGDNGKFLGDTCGTGTCGLGEVVCNPANRNTMICQTAQEPASETCDDADNDCDGSTDEDFGGSGTIKLAGALYSSDNGRYKGQACGTGACSSGVVRCKAGSPMQLECSTNGSAAGETCNGADDDCDGQSDEDYLRGSGNRSLGNALFSTDNGKFKGESCGTGACSSGTIVCSTADPTVLVCNSNGNAATDVCDGADNNCNGSTDEDYGQNGTVKVASALFASDNGKYKGQSCGTGTCSSGTVVCGSNQTSLVCSTNATASADICDGADNNCNGNTDEDYGATGTVKVANALFATDNGKYKGQSCGTGSCSGGTVVCGAGGTTLACSTNTTAATDVCDAVDNNCNGSTDEDYGATGTVKVTGALAAVDNGKYKGQSCGVGPCAGGSVVCGTTTTLACSTNGTATTDTCDAIDNNCNGSTDEDFGQGGTIKVTGALFSSDNGKYKGQSCGTGACTGGTVVCGSATTLSCSSNASAAVDKCDGADNDCDGGTDEDYAVGGTVKLAGALFSGDNGKAKGETCGTGSCSGGTVLCAENQTSLVCSSNLTASTDLCDGQDNNCNGTTDDDYGQNGTVKVASALFSSDNGKYKGQACGTGTCSGGTVVCATSTTLGCSSNGLATAEICDNIDNNCEGSTDESFGANGAVKLTGALFSTDNGKYKGQSCGTGSCTGGSVVCATTSTLGCSSNNLASNDICDSVDNNCNGTTDEDYGATGTVKVTGALLSADNGKYKGQSCGTGNCSGGSVVCGSTTSLVCSTNNLVGVENCDELDNDCDGSTDETYTPGGQFSMTGALFNDDNGKFKGDVCGVGPCTGGTVVCAPSTTGLICTTNLLASTDLCDALDNNCNGFTDENFVAGGSSPLSGALYAADNGKYKGAGCGIGQCNGGTVACSGSKTSLVCSTDGAATSESCDDVDNDCDGLVDQTFASLLTALFSGDVGKPKEATCGAGLCAGGKVLCNVAGTALQCSSEGSALGAEACNAVDDTCNGATDEGFADIDADGIADCVDTCVDVDQDGWGRVGQNSGCLAGKAGVTDCNDLAGNIADVDADNVCVEAGRDNCVGGATAGCNDNCPLNANATQVDADRDGLGDDCDPIPAGCMPYDICGDCLDNNCDGNTDEATCVQARTLTVTAGVDGAPVDYATRLTIDHKGLVDAGVSNANGSDVRIFYKSATTTCSDQNPALCYVELDRVADQKAANTWNTATTTIWFPLEAAIAASGSDANYLVFFNVQTGSPLADEKNVFWFADYFDRGNSNSVGAPWVETEGADSYVSVASSALAFPGAADSRIETPRVQAPFTAVSSGTWKWVFGFDFTYTSGTTYQMLMQLGDSAQLSTASLEGDRATYPNEGIGPSLLWSSQGIRPSFTTANAVLGAQTLTGSTPTFTQISQVNALSEIEVEFQPAGNTYTVSVNGGAASSAFSFGATGVTSVDTIRLITDDISSANGGNRAIPYVYLRRSLGSAAKEPATALSLTSTGADCSLSNANLVARYVLNESSGTSIADSSGVGTAHNLTITTASSSPTLVPLAGIPGLGGLWFTSAATNGRANSTSEFLEGGNDKFVSGASTALNGSTVATMEVVFNSSDVRGGENTAQYIAGLFNENSGSQARFSVQTLGGSVLQASVGNNASNEGSSTPTASAAKWTLNFSTAKRVVLHVIFNSAAATNADRLVVYQDGVKLTQAAAPTSTITQNNVLRLVGSQSNNSQNQGQVVIGNDYDRGNSPTARVGYVAFYKVAMDATTVAKQAKILKRKDD